MQNKQQIDLIKLPSIKIRNISPRFQSSKTNKNISANISRKKIAKKFPSYVVISRGWHLLPVERQILAYLKQIRAHIFRKAGISRITASYLKASHPKSDLKQRVSDRQPSLSPLIWIPVSVHDKLLLNDSLTGGGNLQPRHVTWELVPTNIKRGSFWQFSEFSIPTSFSFMPCSARSTEFQIYLSLDYSDFFICHYKYVHTSVTTGRMKSFYA